MKDDEMVSISNAIKGIDSTFMYFIIGTWLIICILWYIATLRNIKDKREDDRLKESMYELVSAELNIPKEKIIINFNNRNEFPIKTEQGYYLVTFKEHFTKIDKIIKLQELKNKDIH
jgi:hypothetical protein